MSTNIVWAPDAKEVWINVNGARQKLCKSQNGWWTAERPLAHGDKYTFDVDENKNLPDPRSLFLPSGVAGLSQHVDHAAFAWNDAAWQPPSFSSAVIYEAHVGTFSPKGTFDGMAARLDYLRDLGATHLELMPVAEFPGSRGWGYDVVFPYAPHHRYGGPEALKRLVDACHRQGLAVILDVVYNHLGPSGNVLPCFGPYFSKNHQTPWGPGFNFDGPHSDEVRRYICDNALMWLRDFHVDGLRLDSVHEMADASAVHILEQLVNEVRELEEQLQRPLALIGEEGRNDPKYVIPKEQGGFGLTAQWTNDVGMSLHAALTGETSGWYGDFGSWRDVAKAIAQPFVYDGKYSQQRQHTFGRPSIEQPPKKFVAYLQNHDFTGNRQWGGRIGQLTSVDDQKMASAILLLLPYVPLIFQGEEWNAAASFMFFADCHGDEKLTEGAIKGRNMAAKSLGWPADKAPDPGDLAHFERSRLNWEELSQPEHRECLSWYRSLIELRNAYRTSDSPIVCLDGPELLVTLGDLVLIANVGDAPQEILLEDDQQTKVLLCSHPECKLAEGHLVMPARSTVALRVACPGGDRATTSPDQPPSIDAPPFPELEA